MYAFQFLAEIEGPTPLMFDLADIISETSSVARPLSESVGRMPGQWDHYGERQAVFEQATISVSGSVWSRRGGSREPGERASLRLTGQKGWLVAYRFERGYCNACANECLCGQAVLRREPPTWYAAPARLLQVDTAGSAWAQQNGGDQPVVPRMSFVLDRPWERISPDKWRYGDLNVTNILPASITDEESIFTDRHWPMRLAPSPKFGSWWRRPLRWLENAPWLYETCVSHWSSGGWEIGRIGDITYYKDGLTVRSSKAPGYNYLYNPGDWPAPTRLAFTNFARLLVEVYAGGVKEAEIEMREPISDPQYLYIDTSNGELSVRYCPVSDDPCMDLSQLAQFVPEASGSTPAPVTVRGELASCIRPGLVEMRISGFHMPGLPFHWAYDMKAIYS